MSMKILKVAVYWTPEEAHTVHELLQGLQEEVWRLYGQDIRQMHATIQEEQRQQQSLRPGPKPGEDDDF
jgi:hypothetical protein